MRLMACMLMLAAGISAEQDDRPLFNGKDLREWIVVTQGVWHVRGGTIIGKSDGLRHNDFLRTRKVYRDFVLRAKIRIVNGIGNSGIQFRSKAAPNSHEVSGYQADAAKGLWGALYDESRRNEILAAPSPEFQDRVDGTAWHDYTITAKGNKIRLELDGVTTVDYEEKDPGIDTTGFIALQVHSSREPVEIWFKDLMIRELNTVAPR